MKTIKKNPFGWLVHFLKMKKNQGKVIWETRTIQRQRGRPAKTWETAVAENLIKLKISYDVRNENF